MFRRSGLIVFALGLTLLSGCAFHPATPAPERPCGDWPRQQSRLETLTQWTLAGKVAVRTPQEQRSANYDWRQQQDQYRMMISGPFGVGRNTLQGHPGAVELSNSDGTFQAATPEALMAQRMGWSLPISSLHDWIRGLPSPQSSHSMTHDACGFPDTLQQDGWTIQYTRWDYADGYWLPGRLKMSYEDLSATLVVNEWHPGRRDND